jgi:hypothetical protein
MLSLLKLSGSQAGNQNHTLISKSVFATTTKKIFLLLATFALLIGSSFSSSPASAQAVTWTRCATENNPCLFAAGTRTVRYGANGTYSTKTFTTTNANGITCNNGTFGDPIPGTTKYCDLQDVAATGWTRCATENNPCLFAAGTRTVRYGANGTYSTKTFTTTNANGITCNNGTFGDPIPGTTKYCDLQDAATTPPPAPTTCAAENAQCVFAAGTATIKYGGNNLFTSKTFTTTDGNGITCNNANFGDPAPYVAKACEITSFTPAVVTPPPAPATCAGENQQCVFAAGTATIKYGGNNLFTSKSFTTTDGNGITCNNANFGDPAPYVAKACTITSFTPAVVTPPPSTSGPVFSQAQYEAAVKFDFEGENGKDPANPSAASVGYPCNLPTVFAYGTNPTLDVPASVNGRGSQTAGVGYNQIFNVCSDATNRKSVPNARVEFTDAVVDYYSASQNKWIRVNKYQVDGAAYEEDFLNDLSTGADKRIEADGNRSVRSGINNAQPTNLGDAGGRVPDQRTSWAGPVGFLFHGFPARFSMNWSDAKAIVVSQAMKCIPQSGTDLTDCNKLGYVADVGTDSWATLTSPYDKFVTHGGVSGGRMKPVKTTWQVFTNYSGPRDFVGITPPPVPTF